MDNIGIAYNAEKSWPTAVVTSGECNGGMGSGNFLYMSMRALKDLEHKAQIEAELMGFPSQIGIMTGTDNVLGIEINEYAAELARVTVWIGDIQWCQANGRPIIQNPILRSLDSIKNKDALINSDGTEAEWPNADVIIGNPPFLGGSKKSGELGRDYFDALARVFQKDRVPGGADLVCYWFDKARIQIEQGRSIAAGLVATQAIRSGSNRVVLDAIASKSTIFDAWSDIPWINDGAAVRVSLVAFGEKSKLKRSPRLDGNDVSEIYADLTSGEGLDMTQAHTLPENLNTAFKGAEKSGSFEISGETARAWLPLPNPNSRPNSEVLKPWANGQGITNRPGDLWIVDFGVDMALESASLYEQPFEHVQRLVKPEREKNNDRGRRENWWRFGRNGADMRRACVGLERFIVTPRVAKHRFFVWLHGATSPDSRLCLIARSDDSTFGILSSRIHETWALANASMHGVGNDPTYNNASCFETFPFPEGMTPPATKGSVKREGDLLLPSIAEDIFPTAEKIAEAAYKLNMLRENWLNPPEWVDWVITPEEEVAGFPKRPVAKPGKEGELKKRTLTKLYNQRPAWLDSAHKTLDTVVAEAYGWKDYTPEMSENDILSRLLALNRARSA